MDLKTVPQYSLGSAIMALLAKWFDTEKEATVTTETTQLQDTKYSLTAEQLAKLNDLLNMESDLRELSALYRGLKRQAMNERQHRWNRYNVSIQNIEHPQGSTIYNEAKDALLQRRNEEMRNYDLRALQSTITGFFNVVANLKDLEPTREELSDQDKKIKRDILEWISADRNRTPKDYAEFQAKQHCRQKPGADYEQAFNFFFEDVQRRLNINTSPKRIDIQSVSEGADPSSPWSRVQDRQKDFD
jgi:hypothetical protein